MRCTCLKNQVECSLKCRCHNCGNKKPSEKPKAKRRKRTPMSLTSTLAGTTSYEYGFYIGESFSNTKLPSLLHFFLEALIFHLSRQMKTDFDDLDRNFASAMLWGEYFKIKEQLCTAVEVDSRIMELDKNSYEYLFFSFEEI
uniref:Uncharacterized protein n=1 Tax=Clytia hemisphaerica TaxID=252671 RepID=A0A7M5WTZ8_9CNID